MTVTSTRERYGHSRQFLTGGFFLLALVVAMAVFFVARQRAADESARQTMLATNQLSALLSTVRQAESGVRGYLLTGNPFSMQTYNMALAAEPAELQEVDGSFASKASAASLDKLHQLVAVKLSQLAQVMAIYQSGNRPGAIAQVNIDLDMRTMQSLRILIGSLQRQEAGILGMDDAEDTRNGFILQAATALAVLGTVLLGSFAIRDSRLRTAELLAAEAALREANEALERKVDTRTRTLRASETQFRTLAESMPGFVFMTGASGGNSYVNPQFADYTGLTPAEVRDQGWVAALHPDDVAPSLAVWERCVAAGSNFEMEYRFRRHDGVYRWFIGRSQPIMSETGEPAGWIGTCTDIEDRKQAEVAIINANGLLEQRVAERSRELDRIFRLSTDILAVADFDGRYVRVSPAWQPITGHTVEEALAGNYLDFVHPDHLQKAISDFQLLHAGQQVFCENQYRRADGSYCWLSWRAVPLTEEKLIYAVARDITVEKDRDERLRQSQKMEVVGQLTGGIAHDFNNLLTIIMGSLELLQRGLGVTDAKTTRRIEAAMEGGRRAAALTHRLLAFARRQPLEPKPIEPNRLVNSMSDMLSRVLGEHIALEFVTAASLWRVQADVNQLENTILNLVVNARDAMPGGGHLTVETQNVHIDDAYAASRPDIDPGQYVMIAVTDTGMGMTADILAKVFEPFFTTKPQGHGTGLGLAQVYGFIKQSNGHISIYSEPDHGTTVKLYLPRLLGEAREAPRAVVQPENIAPSGRGETILVVEDEDNVRNFTMEVLEDAGYQVLAVENASAALKLLDAAPPIDLLFTDVVLTGNMNGRQLANEVLHRLPGLPVLFTTGYTRNAIIHHGRLDEGIEFIGKPFAASALAQTVRKVLDRARAPNAV